jgi:hypothetical protein
MRAAVVSWLFVRHANARTICIPVANARRRCFYSVRLTMAADAILFELGVRQLAARIPFAAAKLRICANQVNRFFYVLFITQAGTPPTLRFVL